MPSLTRQEARDRSRSITVTSYDVTLDLRTGPATFESTTEIRFTGHQPGGATFVDVKAAEVHQVSLNGRDLDPAAVSDGRLPLVDLAEYNVLRCSATMAYSRDGQGLHRAVDPADGEAYIYGHTFLDAAPRVFACFDQPDLKAPYSVHVDAPPDWQVLGNGAATRVADGRWDLATTQPLATYFVTVCAGPYVSVRSEHDGIPLGLHARASLRGPLERWAPQLLEVTKASFDYYHSLFGIRYPFGEYHQVYVPEFNAGAMENPGCVTVRDSRLFRGAASDNDLLTRARTTAHEMAHMWFGDLVTMRWWDDLWLNESFAEYLASRTLVAATEFTDAWVSFGIVRKTWGYAAERAPSTHPVAGGGGARRGLGTAGLRRHLLRQGRFRAAAAPRLRRRRGVRRRDVDLPSRARLRQREPGRPPRRGRAGQRQGPHLMERGLAAHRGPRPAQRGDDRRGRRRHGG